MNEIDDNDLQFITSTLCYARSFLNDDGRGAWEYADLLLKLAKIGQIITEKNHLCETVNCLFKSQELTNLINRCVYMIEMGKW